MSSLELMGLCFLCGYLPCTCAKVSLTNVYKYYMLQKKPAVSQWMIKENVNKGTVNMRANHLTEAMHIRNTWKIILW